MKRATTHREKEKTIEDISDFLSENYGDITAAYIFGSFLTSEQYSDLDIAVFISEGTEEILEFEFALEAKLEAIARCPVDARVLNRAPVSFSQNVIRGGRVVLDRDPNARADFESRVLSLYFDFAPFRRRYLKEVGDAPVSSG